MSYFSIAITIEPDGHLGAYDTYSKTIEEFTPKLCGGEGEKIIGFFPSSSNEAAELLATLLSVAPRTSSDECLGYEICELMVAVFKGGMEYAHKNFHNKE